MSISNPFESFQNQSELFKQQDPSNSGLRAENARNIMAEAEKAVALEEAKKVARENLGYATGGIIKGPGTGTSDSIPAKLPVGGAIIPADVVKLYGKDYFNKLEAAVPDAGGGKEKVTAKISNGEFQLSPEAVAFWGKDVINKLIGSDNESTEQAGQPDEVEAPKLGLRGYAEGGVVNPAWGSTEPVPPVLGGYNPHPAPAAAPAPTLGQKLFGTGTGPSPLNGALSGKPQVPGYAEGGLIRKYANGVNEIGRKPEDDVLPVNLPQSELRTVKSDTHNIPDQQTFIPKLLPVNQSEQVKVPADEAISGRGARANYATMVNPVIDSGTLTPSLTTAQPPNLAQAQPGNPVPVIQGKTAATPPPALATGKNAGLEPVGMSADGQTLTRPRTEADVAANLANREYQNKWIAANAANADTQYAQQNQGLAATAPQLNILGEKVQTLGEDGGYQQHFKGGGSATIMPWKATNDDALQRTLTKEQYLAARVPNLATTQNNESDNATLRANNEATVGQNREQANQVNSLGRDELAQRKELAELTGKQTKYQAVRNPDDNTTQMVPESGPGANEAYQGQQQAKARTESALAILDDPNASSEHLKAARSWLASKGVSIPKK